MQPYNTILTSISLGTLRQLSSKMPNVHIFPISLENVSFRFYESEVNRKTRSPTPNNYEDMHTRRYAFIVILKETFLIRTLEMITLFETNVLLLFERGPLQD